MATFEADGTILLDVEDAPFIAAVADWLDRVEAEQAAAQVEQAS